MSQRRRGYDVDIPRKSAAPPRLRRGYSEESSAAATTWIFRGKARRRRGYDVDIPRKSRGAAAATTLIFRGSVAAATTCIFRGRVEDGVVLRSWSA